MSFPSKTFGIDSSGRVLLSEAAQSRVASAQLTVSTSAVELKTNEAIPLRRRKLLVKNINESGIIVYVGGANVSTANGFPLYAWDELELDVTSDALVKAIASGDPGQVNVHILEVE